MDFGWFRKREVVTRLQTLKTEFHFTLHCLIAGNFLLLLLTCWALTPNSYSYITFIWYCKIDHSQSFILNVYLLFHSWPCAIDRIFRAITIEVLTKSRILTWFIEKPESTVGNYSCFNQINLLRSLFAGSKFDLWRFMILWVKKNYFCELSMYAHTLTVSQELYLL